MSGGLNQKMNLAKVVIDMDKDLAIVVMTDFPSRRSSRSTLSSIRAAIVLFHNACFVGCEYARHIRRHPVLRWRPAARVGFLASSFAVFLPGIGSNISFCPAIRFRDRFG